MNGVIVYKGFYSNELFENTSKGTEEIATALNGQFHNGYTVMKLWDLDESVEGSDMVLDVVLKELVNHKQSLKDGKVVNVYVEWTLSNDRTKYTSCNFIKTEVIEKGNK